MTNDHRDPHQATAATQATTAARARRHRVLGTAAAGVVGASLVLAGCSTPVPKVTPGPVATQPALSLDQDTQVLDKIGSVLTVADKKRDPKALAQRLTGPALAIRTAELEVAKTRGSDADVTDLPTSVQTVVVPTDTAWPRPLFAVSTQPRKDEPPRLMVLTQASARADYELWGWARLFPGTTMPAFPAADLGTQSVAADDASLVVTPTAAVASYLDVLTKGSASQHAKELAKDPFRTTIAATTTKWTGNADFKKADGSYSITFARTKTPLVALRTDDGGALVVAEAKATEKISAEKGAVIAPPNAVQAALLGKTKPTNHLVVTYRDVVAVYVPPAGATGDAAAVKVLGVEHVPVTVTAG